MKTIAATAHQFEIAGIVAPIIRTLQAGERIVRRNEAGELVTLDLTEIAKRIGDATGYKIAVARRTPVKVTDATGKVIAQLSPDELMARLLSKHFGVEIVAPKPGARATLFWCECGDVVAAKMTGGIQKRCRACAKVVEAKQRREWRLAHPEKVREIQARTIAKNGDKYRERERLKRSADPEPYRAAFRDYYMRNADAMRARSRAYAESRKACRAGVE